jgi:hypothetical protein
MKLRALVLACGALIGGVNAANAACVVNHPEWGHDAVLRAQRLIRFSESATVSQAYVAGTCTLTALVHHSGDPCPDTDNTEHATVTVDTIEGAYHVFTTHLAGGYCTTH